MRYLFRMLLVVLIGYGGNVYAGLIDANVCKIDNWNDSWGGKVSIKNICDIKILDKETAEAILAKLENLDLSKPVRTAVEGAIQGLKKELEGTLKPLFNELKSLLKEGTDQTGKLIDTIDQKLKKRIAQIADEVRKTVTSFRKDIVALIEQVEKSVRNIMSDAKDHTKDLLKETEASILNIEQQLIADLKDMTASLNIELSKKFETIRTNIKTDIMFIGDYLSCKAHGAAQITKEHGLEIAEVLPLAKEQKKLCQNCNSGFLYTMNKYLCSLNTYFCPKNVYT
ncbi:MAG: hypothetical protein KAG43_04080 [Candidatus Marithrix sp.]|nr:hypothetical protein [Candidatus Marithrix sp.]